jgi:hypothetical protein
MPEWYFVIAALLLLASLGSLWPPLVMAVPLLVLAAGTSICQAVLSASRAAFAPTARSSFGQFRLRATTVLLHLIQPLARLSGRQRYGLTPWRWRGTAGLALPRPRAIDAWTEQRQEPEEWLRWVDTALRLELPGVLRGGGFDRWDLEVRGGLLGGVRLRMATEEHGSGSQLLRFWIWPRVLPRSLALSLVLSVLAVAAGGEQSWLACAVLGALAAAVWLRTSMECATAMQAALGALCAMDRQAGRATAGATERTTVAHT